VDDEPLELEVEDVDVVEPEPWSVEEAESEPDDPPHAARASEATPMPATVSIRRRVNKVPMSKAKPWSTNSWSGRGSTLPS
jgi:hypothetical protein